MCLHSAPVSSSMSSANSRSFVPVSKNVLLRFFVPVSSYFLLESVPVSTLESVPVGYGLVCGICFQMRVRRLPGPTSTFSRLLESLMSREEK